MGCVERVHGMTRSGSNLKKFEKDLAVLLERIAGDNPRIREKLERLKRKLVKLHYRGEVKINHSVMELLCAKPLLLRGYEVDVERKINGVLTCDVYGTKGNGSLIVEIETGFVPPEHALDPSTYCRARIASKIARYSNYATKFALGIPPYYIIEIPEVFVKPPRHREIEELREVKKLCDLYYSNPPVSIEEIRSARIHAIYIIDVDGAEVREVDPYAYLKNSSLVFYNLTYPRK